MVSSKTYKSGSRKGEFKDGFKGCEAKMKSQGKSPESSKKICASIGRKAGKIK